MIRYRIPLALAAVVALAASVLMAMGVGRSSAESSYAPPAGEQGRSSFVTQDKNNRSKTGISALEGDTGAAPGADDSKLERQGGDPQRTRALAEELSGKNLEKVKLLRTFDDRSVLAVLGSDEVCVRVRTAGGGGSMGCAPRESAVDTGTPIISKIATDGGRYIVTALTPDGLDSFSVQTATGMVALESRNNVATGVVAGPVAFSWTDAEGQGHQLPIGRDPVTGE